MKAALESISPQVVALGFATTYFCLSSSRESLALFQLGRRYGRGPTFAAGFQVFCLSVAGSVLLGLGARQLIGSRSEMFGAGLLLFVFWIQNNKRHLLRPLGNALMFYPKKRPRFLSATTVSFATLLRLSFLDVFQLGIFALTLGYSNPLSILVGALSASLFVLVLALRINLFRNIRIFYLRLWCSTWLSFGSSILLIGRHYLSRSRIW
jgi:hypothetical protein